MLLGEGIDRVVERRVRLEGLSGSGGDRAKSDAAFDPVEVIATADIIFGEDVTDPSKRFVVHGKERLERLTAGAVDEEVNVAGVRIVWVEIDIDTDEYDKLIEVVTAIKGPEDDPLVAPAG